MFRLKSIIAILTIILGVQNAFPQKSVKKSNHQKSSVGKSAVSPKSNQTVSTDGRIYNRAIGGIVIIATGCDGSRDVSQGSGFVVGDEYIITNRHVVECGNETKVKLLVSQEIFDVTGVFFHPDKDLAILRVPKLNGKNISLKLAPPNTLKMNHLVYVLGNPKNIEGYFSKGNIRLIRTGKFFFDAPIAPGSSGSPVLDTQGRVVGIETTGTTLAGGMIFGGALFSSEVAGLLPSVQKGLIVNAVDKRAKSSDNSSEMTRNKNQPPAPSPSVRRESSGIGALVGALLGVFPSPTKSQAGAPDKPKVVREPTVEELIAKAEDEVKYSPQSAIEAARKVLARLPKDADRREPDASRAHGIIAEGYVRLNQTDDAARHILQAWKDGDFIRVSVKQQRQNKDFSNVNPGSLMNFVDGVIIMGNKTFVYRQDGKSVGKSFPDQSFTAKDGEVIKVEYNSIQKKLSMVVKIGSANGKDSKKDFQFYPPEALWLTGPTSYGALRQINCQRCSDILSVLVKASNEFVRQEKTTTIPSR